ncbi:alpha/beta hydrolase, partial [Embleya scabrispora]|uniref:alpha/beta hydrolase n=1 Tax=Embleya scabrispora TaxID=159449 RepID=UPI000362BF0F
PRGATLDLAVARRRATDPTHRIGSLVVDFGGPGSPGASDVVGKKKDAFSAEVRARFDIVGFDPRGWGASNPLQCDPLGPRPDADPITPTAFAEFVTWNRASVAGCRPRTGSLYDHLDTLSVVRDIDALRAALGDRRLNFWGLSYGSLMAQQYAEVFPRRFRALVADGNLDHSSSGARWLETSAAAVEDSFREFTTWCDTNTDCVLHGRDVGAVVDRLYARAEAGTLYDPAAPDVGITPMTFLGQVQGTFKNPGWRQLAAGLRTLDATTPHPTQPGIRPPVDIDPRARQAVVCSDWALNFADANELAAVDRRSAALAPHMRRSFSAWYLMTPCLGQPVRLTNPPHPYRISSTKPILLVNGAHDAATPYPWAVEAGRRIPGATLLTYDGWGHGGYDHSPCAAALTDRYLIDLAPPPPNTHCPAVPPAG